MTRGKPLSKDLRHTIINLRRNCVSLDEIVTKSACKRRTLQRILSQHRKRIQGTLLLTTDLRGRKRKISIEDMKLIHGLLANTPDMYLDELKQQLEERRGTQVSITTIWRTLRQTGYKLKKITRVAIEQDEFKRAQFKLTYSHLYQAAQLVFMTV
ncbi:Homeodomain-like partial [Lentinula edodes]|uniref:Homeodomain-like partial n=1 Tax=Lentinula edodes TaxID=5353 RepID=A0A1Q3E2F3_LENED|nr:Homeodomain-like partial [Lentinula edodes]